MCKFHLWRSRASSTTFWFYLKKILVKFGGIIHRSVNKWNYKQSFHRDSVSQKRPNRTPGECSKRLIGLTAAFKRQKASSNGAILLFRLVAPTRRHTLFLGPDGKKSNRWLHIFSFLYSRLKGRRLLQITERIDTRRSIPNDILSSRSHVQLHTFFSPGFIIIQFA